jgi:hypothetical protein
MFSMATRIEALGGVLRSWWARIWVLGGAGAGIYQFGCDQFSWPKIPALWGMTGVVMPWWGWLVIAQMGFTYGLFEYVRRASIPAPVDGPDPAVTRLQYWEDLKRHMLGVAQSIGQAMGGGGAFQYRSAVSDAETFLLQFTERTGFAIPELRADGEKVGCMRALLYITDISPVLALNNQAKAQHRASELTNWLNGLGEAELTRLVKADEGPSYF